MTSLMDGVTDAPTLTPCQLDPEAWFPNQGSANSTARRFCAACPVVDACLEVALTLEGDSARQFRHGIWGGLTPQERYDEAMSRAADARRAA